MRSDPVFCVQLAVSVLGLALSTGMLIAGRDAAVYLPVLTSIVGYWLPAPRRNELPRNAIEVSGTSVNQRSNSIEMEPATVERNE